MKNSFKPVIRFSQYNDNLSKVKLGQLVQNFKYGLNASATKYDGENKYIRITDISDQTHLFLYNNLTSPRCDLSKSSDYLLRKGDILFARTGASVGKSYIYSSHDGKVYFAGFLIRARLLNDYDPEFVFQQTLTSNYNKFIKVMSIRSGQPGINANEYSKFSFMLPTYDEQRLIGIFLKKLDCLIQLQEQKLDKLRQLKKGYLQKMFLLNENGFPKLRLNKFYFGWEKINFKYLIKLDINKNVNLEFTQGDTLAAAKMLPNDLRKNSSNEYLKTYNIIRYSEIAYEGNNSKDFKYGRFVLNDFKDGIISHVFPVYKFLKPFDIRFMKLYIHDESVMQKILLYSTTQSLQMDTLKSNELYKQKIRLPSLDEQISIGNFFKKFDDTMYYNHLKLSNLKKLKQGYLQKMFC